MQCRIFKSFSKSAAILFHDSKQLPETFSLFVTEFVKIVKTYVPSKVFMKDALTYVYEVTALRLNSGVYVFDFSEPASFGGRSLRKKRRVKRKSRKR